ncbi:MAG: 4-oxalocrotonate tautomerase [Elusimicrobia bacterium RIFOXYB2_FULL_48_7]|nr:MAG: 4-oxalocrotonate tautomerase [Elusimicrobia bacterium RIFOXYB2_FULL_48_7]
MPVIKIEMWKGRTHEQKKKLVEKVTSATVESIGCPPEAVQIIINEVDKENWGLAGQLASEKAPGK